MTKEERKEYNRKYREAHKDHLRRMDRERRAAKKEGIIDENHLFLPKAKKRFIMTRNAVRVANQLGMKDTFCRQDVLYTKIIEAIDEILELRNIQIPYPVNSYEKS